MEPVNETRRRNDTRNRLLEIALKLVATAGFSALDLKHLSDAASMSISGVRAVFGSAEEMRRAVINCGAAVWERDVVAAADGQAGLSRVWAAWAYWIRHARTLPTFLDVLPGLGDASRSRDANALASDVVVIWKRWGSFVAASVAAAGKEGELRAPVRPFELHLETLTIAARLPWLSYIVDPAIAIDRTARGLFGAINSKRATPWPDTELKRVLEATRGQPLGAELLGFSDLGSFFTTVPF